MSPGTSVELCSCPSLNQNLFSRKARPSLEGKVNVLPSHWQGQAELAVAREGAAALPGMLGALSGFWLKRSVSLAVVL